MKNHLEKVTIHCPACKASFTRSKDLEKSKPLVFCAYCGALLKEEAKVEFPTQEQFPIATLVKEHAVPEASEIMGTLGQYQLLKSIGKGGMGEVFLAYDTMCGRRMALKRVRADLFTHTQLQNRFIERGANNQPAYSSNNYSNLFDPF